MLSKAGYRLLPAVCLICGGFADAKMDCCSGCAADLPVARHACIRCGLTLHVAGKLCGRCSRRPPAFDRAWAGYAYHHALQVLIRRFKFQRNLAAGRVLAALTARRLVALGAHRPQALVPVPLHWRRELWRGFNQSRLLAGDLSAQLGQIPVLEALRRVRATRAQSGLKAVERRRNLRGAFGVTGRLHGLRHVALVDDVMTTGTTLAICAAALKNAGVGRVDVWMVARA